MADWEIFRARAAEARADADSATLENVKDRCLRAEAAWNAMASRAERNVKFRAAQDAEKAVAAAPAEPIGQVEPQGFR